MLLVTVPWVGRLPRRLCEDELCRHVGSCTRGMSILGQSCGSLGHARITRLLPACVTRALSVNAKHVLIASCCRLQIFEKKPATVSNYGIWMRYDSRTGHHNMYR